MAELLAGPRRWWLIGIVGVLVILLGGWFLVVAPQRAGAEEAAAQAVQADQRAAQAASQVKVLQQQSAQLDTVKKELEALQAKIPTGEQVSALLVSVNKLAGASGVALTSFKPGTVTALDSSAPDKGTARLGYLPISLTGTGSFNQIRAYLAQLETLDRALVVTSVAISSGGGSGSGTAGSAGSAGSAGTANAGPLTMTLEARVFVRGDAVPAPAAPSPKASGSGAK